MIPNYKAYLLIITTLTFISNLVQCQSFILLQNHFTLPSNTIKIYCQQGDTLQIQLQTKIDIYFAVSIEKQDQSQNQKQFLIFSQFQDNSQFSHHTQLTINQTKYYKIQLILLSNSITQTTPYKLTAKTFSNQTQISGNFYENQIGPIYVIEQEYIKQQQDISIQLTTQQETTLQIIQNNQIIQNFILNKGTNKISLLTKNQSNIIIKIQQNQQTKQITNCSILIQISQNYYDPQNFILVGNQTQNQTETPSDQFLFNRTAFWILSIASPVVLLILIISLCCYCKCSRNRREQQYEPRQWQPAPSNYFDFLQSAQVLNQSADPMMTCSVCLEHQCNVTLPCNHSFHNQCIREWVNRNRNCPNCRKDVIRMYGIEH